MSLSMPEKFDVSFEMSVLMEYGEDWESCIFEVAGQLVYAAKAKFLHAQIYSGHENHFVDLFQKRGHSPDNPLVLDEDISVKDMQCFLRLLYPIGWKMDLRTASEWMSVLKLSTRWYFEQYREKAIWVFDTKLADMPLEQKVFLGINYHHFNWVHHGLLHLAQHSRLITASMVDTLGFEVAHRLGQIIQRRDSTTSQLETDGGIYSKNYISVEDDLEHAFGPMLRDLRTASEAFIPAPNIVAESTSRKRKADPDSQASPYRSRPPSPGTTMLFDIPATLLPVVDVVFSRDSNGVDMKPSLTFDVDVHMPSVPDLVSTPTTLPLQAPDSLPDADTVIDNTPVSSDLELRGNAVPDAPLTSTVELAPVSASHASNAANEMSESETSRSRRPSTEQSAELDVTNSMVLVQDPAPSDLMDTSIDTVDSAAVSLPSVVDISMSASSADTCVHTTTNASLSRLSQDTNEVGESALRRPAPPTFTAFDIPPRLLPVTASLTSVQPGSTASSRSLAAREADSDENGAANLPSSPPFKSARGHATASAKKAARGVGKTSASLPSRTTKKTGGSTAKEAKSDMRASVSQDSAAPATVVKDSISRQVSSQGKQDKNKETSTSNALSKSARSVLGKPTSSVAHKETDAATASSAVNSGTTYTPQKFNIPRTRISKNGTTPSVIQPSAPGFQPPKLSDVASGPGTSNCHNPEYRWTHFDTQDKREKTDLLQTITCMNTYSDYSLEELRMQDYRQGVKMASKADSQKPPTIYYGTSQSLSGKVEQGSETKKPPTAPRADRHLPPNRGRGHGQ